MQVSRFSSTGFCVSSGLSRSRCKDKIRHARKLSREMPVTENLGAGKLKEVTGAGDDERKVGRRSLIGNLS